jgi:hypothetical protein
VSSRAVGGSQAPTKVALISVEAQGSRRLYVVIMTERRLEHWVSPEAEAGIAQPTECGCEAVLLAGACPRAQSPGSVTARLDR